MLAPTVNMCEDIDKWLVDVAQTVIENYLPRKV